MYENSEKSSGYNKGVGFEGLDKSLVKDENLLAPDGDAESGQEDESDRGRPKGDGKSLLGG